MHPRLTTFNRLGRFGMGMCALAAVLFVMPDASRGQESGAVITAQHPRLGEYSLGEVLRTGEKTQLAMRQEIMLWIASGQVAVVVQGPAVFQIDELPDQLNINLETGRLLVTAGQMEGAQPVHIVAGAADALQFDLPAPPGTTVIVRAGADADFGRLDSDGGAAEPITLTLLGEEAQLAPNEHVSLRNGAATRDKASDWMKDATVAVTAADGLGFGSAKSWRGKTCSSLFSNLAYWDKTAQNNPVLLLPSEPETFQPEVRTVTAQINALPGASQSSRNTPNTVSFAGANEVPGISPAAISVGGAGGVAANNAEARSLLSLTGSRGLGFNGLSLLGIRGTSSGIRAPGPAGIGGP